MTIGQARKRIWTLRLIGVVLVAIAGVFVITSIVKYLHTLSLEQNLFTILFGPCIKVVVSYAYHYLLFPFWNIGPDISLPPPLSIDHLYTSDNAWFVAFYAMLVVGGFCFSKASFIVKRVQQVKEKIADEALHRSMGGTHTVRSGIDVAINLPGEKGWFTTFHALWLAPVGVAIIVYLLGMN